MTDQLERRLVALGAELSYPETPQFRDWAAETAQPKPAGPRRVVLVAGLAALVILVVLAIPGPREAIARLFGIGAVSLSVVEELPETSLEQAPSGVVVDLAVAHESIGFDLLTLESPPDIVYLDESVPGGLVTLGYGRGDSFLLMVTQLQGETDAPSLQKLLTPGTSVVEVEVDGGPAFWIEGEPHVLLLFDREGNVIEDSARLVGNTLIFIRDGLTVRIEGAFDLEHALKVATELSA